MVLANMATYPDRRDVMMGAINTILPQVDHLNIYLNEYESIPPELDHPKINAVLAPKGNIRDSGKFYFTTTAGYCFTIDDDLIYPQDYVKTLISKLQEHDNKIAVTCHGKKGYNPISSFLKGYKKAYTVFGGFIEDQWINIAGTGCLAFHTKAIQPRIEHFVRHGMADLWFSIYCQKRKIPILAIAHEKDWIGYNKGMANKDTLYRQYCGNDKYQTEVFNKLNWKVYGTS